MTPAPDILLRTRALIRLALLSGVLLFGAVSWYVHHQSGAALPDPSQLAAMRLAIPAIFVIALVGAAVIRFTSGSLSGAALFQRSLIGWAMGEAAGLLGGVYFFVSGDPTWYLGGLMILVATFVLLPLRRD